MRIALSAYFLLGDDYDALSYFFDNKKTEISWEAWISSLLSQRIYSSMDNKRKDKDVLTPLSGLTCGDLLFSTLKHETENFTYSGHAFVNTEKLNISEEDEDRLMEYYKLTNSGYSTYCHDYDLTLIFDEDGSCSEGDLSLDEEVANVIKLYSEVVSLVPESIKSEVKKKLKEAMNIVTC